MFQTLHIANASRGLSAIVDHLVLKDSVLVALIVRRSLVCHIRSCLSAALVPDCFVASSSSLAAFQIDKNDYLLT